VTQRRKAYRITLTPDDYVRVSMDIVRGKAVRFAVQYVARIGDEWHPIVRFDTAHGRAHMDISRPDGTQETFDLPFADYSASLTYAIRNIQERWEFYRERYERWRDGS